MEKIMVAIFITVVLFLLAGFGTLAMWGINTVKQTFDSFKETINELDKSICLLNLTLTNQDKTIEILKKDVDAIKKHQLICKSCREAVINE